jgi:hypothetical protein
MKGRFVFLYLISLFFISCASKPVVRMENVDSLAKYGAFEVVPVTNETGKTYDFDVAGELTKYIKSQLKERGYVVGDNIVGEKSILIIKSSLIAFKPGSAFKRWLLPGVGKTHATVRISLIDKASGTLVGEMVSTEVVSRGGLYSAGADHWILNTIAKGVVNEIDKRMNVE